MQVAAGVPYRWMFTNLFPQLRNAVAVSLFLKSDIRAARDAAVAAARAAADAAVADSNASRASADASKAASEASSDIAEAIRAAQEAAETAARAATEAKDAADRAQVAAAQAVKASEEAAATDEVPVARSKAREAEEARMVAESAQAAAEASLSAAQAAQAAAEALALAQKQEKTETAEISEPSVPSELSGNHTPRHLFALKTNVIYDVLLMPNLEFEWLFNDKWSVALEADVAWWSNDSRHKYYQLFMVSPEVRRWFRTPEPWHGMYVGVFAGAGKYDLENGGTGYKGEGGMAGVSFGYMWPISRCFSLEAAVGAGYMYTRYKEYIPYDDHYLYQRTKSLNYFGPLKLKFAVAWRFNDINKPKKVNPAI
ncbi:MAG: DUF3575 domain-containing protein [Muribaculaceae bacterium]|nr:DUF3575 domain-containing protein [Muribaculaceae bacterium]